MDGEGDLRDHLAQAHERGELSRIDRRRARGASTDRDRAPWVFVVPVLAALVVSVVVALRNLALGFRPTSGDGALFLYSGLEFARGRTPYLHTWDVKPPGIHVTTGVLALVSGGDKSLLYMLGNAVNVLGIVVACAAVAGIVYRVTQQRTAAIVGGVAPLATLPVQGYLWGGPRVKYLAVGAGLVAVWCLLDRRQWRTAGASSALAVLYWQPAVLFPALAAVVAYRDGARSVRRMVVGMATAAVVVVGPVVAFGGGRQMVSQAVVAPLLLDSQVGSGPSSTLKFVDVFGPSVGVILVAAAGLVAALALAPRWRHDTVVAGTPAAWFLLVVLTVDMDAGPDLIPLALTSGVGIGLLWASRYEIAGVFDALSPRARRALVSALVVGVLVLTAAKSPLLGGVLPFQEAPRGIYWTAEHARGCHVRLSQVERAWIDAAGSGRGVDQCRAVLFEVFR